MKNLYLLTVAGFLLALRSAGQSAPGSEPHRAERAGAEADREPPAYQLFRAAERYDYLRDSASAARYARDWADPVKFIPLGAARRSYLTLGGQARTRYEHFVNRNWTPEDEGFYSQRLSLHASLWAGQHLRVFGELYHGLVSGEAEPTESDRLNVHQAFVEWHSTATRAAQWTAVAGRQELAFGAARLVGLRDGPNIRRSFDALQVQYGQGSTSLRAFYGREVQLRFGVLDNRVEVFDRHPAAPALWGVYSQFALPGDVGKNELYYLGFQSPYAVYDDARGAETRHTLGLRRFGLLGQVWRYNSEVMVQLGRVGDQGAAAWALETDWHYVFKGTRLRPEIGGKIDLISGDVRAGNGRLGTFNALFTNPEYFSLAGTIAPVNLLEFHPSLSVSPSEKVSIYAEWATFFRYSTADGVYAPPRFLARSGRESGARFIGHQWGVKVRSELSRHLSADMDLSYFVAGPFLTDTGEDQNIFHLAPTVSFTF